MLMTSALVLKDKRQGAKSDQALRKVLNILDHDCSHKIRLEDFLDLLEEHGVTMEPEEVLEMCELTEETGEIGHSTLVIFVKNSRVWRSLEKPAPAEDCPSQQNGQRRTKIEAISYKANKVHAAFKVLDSDRDGFVTKSDFKKKFQNLNTQQIDIVFQRYDRSSRGRLSFVEFKNFMSRRPLPLRLDSRRSSILSLPSYSEEPALHPQDPALQPALLPSYSELSLCPPPTYSSLQLVQPPRYSSLGASDSPPDYSLEDRTGDRGGQEEDREDKEDGGRVTRELSSMSRTCRESFEEEDREEEQEEEGTGEQELCTISEEQGEA